MTSYDVMSRARRAPSECGAARRDTCPIMGHPPCASEMALLGRSRVLVAELVDVASGSLAVRNGKRPTHYCLRLSLFFRILLLRLRFALLLCPGDCSSSAGASLFCSRIRLGYNASCSHHLLSPLQMCALVSACERLCC